MGLIKDVQAPLVEEKESLTGQVSILQNMAKAVGGRDFNAEARGKTRCSLYGAAVSGLGTSLGMTIDWNNEESVNKFVALCKKVADEGVAYSFEGK